ncbi:MAG: hypothetical protein Q8O89_06120 [Nanoarchaeota archaeon]|nr:hypothetical protein [Nanoarchaeota archaeon]
METRNHKTAICSKCGSTDLYFYEGCLGYESVRCSKCGHEHTDENPVDEK